MRLYPGIVHALRSRRGNIVVVGADVCDARAQAEWPETDRSLGLNDPSVDECLHAVESIRLLGLELVAVLSLKDALVVGAAVIADVLGLPGIGRRTAELSVSKIQQRLLLDGLGPPYRLLAAGETYTPVVDSVAKPLHGHQSAGVVLAPAHTPLSATTDLLVEDRVRGQECSVELLVHDGVVRWSGVTQKETTEEDGPYFVEMAHRVPAADVSVEQEARLREAGQALADAVQAHTGVLHSEWRLAASGPVLMEFAARRPGDAIMALYGLAYRQPFEAALVALAFGDEPAFPCSPPRAAAQVFLPHHPGVLHAVRAPEDFPTWHMSDRSRNRREIPPADDECHVVELTILKQPGDLLGPIRDSSCRCAAVVIEGPDPHRVREFEESVLDRIKVEVA